METKEVKKPKVVPAENKPVKKETVPTTKGQGEKVTVISI